MSKLKVDELQESTTDSNITVASGTNLVVTDSLTVDGDSTFGEDVLNSTPAYTKLAVLADSFVIHKVILLLFMIYRWVITC